jgi:hypothetical protein
MERLLFQKTDAASDPVSSASPPEKVAQLESAISALLAILESRFSRGELTLADPIITLACEHIDQAIAAGAEQGFSQRLGLLLSGLAPKPGSASSTPHMNGVVLKPPPTAEMVPAPERRRVARPAAEERRSGHEGRRFKRYVAPVLLVWIGGQAYRTLDWSIGGLCVAGAHPDLVPGVEVMLRLRVESLPGHPPFEDRAILLRSDLASGRLNLRFKSGTSATLKVLELLSRVHIIPAESPA